MFTWLRSKVKSLFGSKTAHATSTVAQVQQETSTDWSIPTHEIPDVRSLNSETATTLNLLIVASFLRTCYEELWNVDDLNGAVQVCLAHLGTLIVQSARTILHLTSPLGTTNPLEERRNKNMQMLFGLYTELEHVSQTVSTRAQWVDAAEEFPHFPFCIQNSTRLLVERSTALPPLPQHLALLKFLSLSLAVDAFSACLRSQSPTDAVELLEQGRGVFWSQLTRLRSPLDDVITSGPEGKVLADQFTRLTSLIRATLQSSGGDQHVWRLSLELKKVVSNIRELPSLSIPSSFVVPRSPTRGQRWTCHHREC